MSNSHPIHRRLQDHWIWTKEKFSMGQAWIDLILFASYKNRKVLWAGEVFEIKAGQLIWSKRSLCKRWKWSRPKLERFLKVLENDEMLIQQAIPQTTLITLCNYSKLRELAFSSDTTNDTTNDTTTVPPSFTKQEGKEGKEGKEGNTLSPQTGSKKRRELKYSEGFERFWKKYPSRNGVKKEKPEAWKEWNKLPETVQALCEKAAENYAQCPEVKDGYAKDACRFLRKEDISEWAKGKTAVKELTLAEKLKISRQKAHDMGIIDPATGKVPEDQGVTYDTF
jgi:hypothetical protein